MALQIRRGTEAERTAGGGAVFAEGELIYVTDTDALYIGDGSTAGGVLLASDALADISAMLTANTIDDQLELEKELVLNGNDITGTGNIDITGNINATGNIIAGGNIDIGDAPGDTVTITAQVDSSITPETDTTYDLGTMSKRWRNVYANGATIDGQIDAVAINADVVADNSTVMVDVSTNAFTGDLTGDVTGNLIGNVTGDVLGNTTGYHTGDVTGSVFADGSSPTPIVDGVNGTLNGNLTGDVTGNLLGNVVSSTGVNVLNPGGIEGTANYIGTVQGNVTGNLTGDVTGDVTGNLTGDVTGNTTGYHTGDVKGSVFADGSTLLVDAVAGTIPGENITGTITANLTGNVTGDLTGNVTGDIFTNTIDSADSSAISFTPIVNFNSDVTIDNSLIMGNINSKIEVTTIGGVGSSTLYMDTSVEINDELVVEGILSAQSGINLNEYIRLGIPTGGVDGQGDPEFTPGFLLDEQKADFIEMPVKFPNFTQTEIDALDSEVGMVVFNTTDSKLQVCTGAGTGGAATYVDLH